MTENILPLLPGQKQLDQSIGFEARSVGVTNYTGSFVRLDDSPPDIPPWTYGVMRALPRGTRQARARLVAVTPAALGPPVPLSQATLTFSDQELPPVPGQLLVAQTLAPGNAPATQNLNANSSITFPIPPGAVYATLLIPGTSTGQIVYTVAGNNSPGTYLSETIPATGQFPKSSPRLIRLLLEDTQLVVTSTAQSVGFTTVTFEFHTDSNGPRNYVAANDLFWQVTADLTGAGTLTASSPTPTQSNMKTVLDFAIFTLAAGTGRVYLPAVWDGGVGTGTKVAKGQLGNQSAGGNITPAPVIFQGFKSSIGNPLGFDLGFANVAGEASAVSANGHYE